VGLGRGIYNLGGNDMTQAFEWCLSHWMICLTGFIVVLLSLLGMLIWVSAGGLTGDPIRDLFFVIGTGSLLCAPLHALTLLYVKYLVEGKFFD
jgi:uncharacterized membrane protein